MDSPPASYIRKFPLRFYYLQKHHNVPCLKNIIRSQRMNEVISRMAAIFYNRAAMHLSLNGGIFRLPRFIHFCRHNGWLFFVKKFKINYNMWKSCFVVSAWEYFQNLDTKNHCASKILNWYFVFWWSIRYLDIRSCITYSWVLFFIFIHCQEYLTMYIVNTTY